MNLAFVYAGQGSQIVGMGKDLYEAEPVFKAVLDTLSPELRSLMFDGPSDVLSQTENTQPCMVAFATAVTAVLYSHGIRPLMAAGLSLGEYSALHAAGVFTAEQAIDLVHFRGKVMANAAKGIESKMCAVLQLPCEELLSCCEEASKKGCVTIANYNCPGQLVLAGEAGAVDYAAELALQKGARRCMPLSVSGPFHTPLMRAAGDALKNKFETTDFGKAEFPVVFNCTGRFLAEDETIPDLLVRQVQNSVYFEDSIRLMEENGIDTIVEIGPGKVLSGFVKKTCRQMKVMSIENCQTLNDILPILKDTVAKNS